MAFTPIDQTTPLYPDFPQGIQVVAPLQHVMNIDCSGAPNYPAATWGQVYIVTVAGRIGGIYGVHVPLDALLFCNVDISPSGDQALVGNNWKIYGEVSGVSLWKLDNNGDATPFTTGIGLWYINDNGDLVPSTTVQADLYWIIDNKGDLELI